MEHAFRDRSMLSRTGQALVSNGMFQIEQYPGAGTFIAFVDEGGALPEQSSVAFEGQANDRIEQRMARADKCSQRLSRRGHQGFLESDALVCRRYRLSGSRAGVPSTDGLGHTGDLVPLRFALLHGSAELLERIPEKSLDEMRLQAPHFGPVHFCADAPHFAVVHDGMCKRMVFQQVLEFIVVQRIVDDRG